MIVNLFVDGRRKETTLAIVIALSESYKSLPAYVSHTLRQGE